MDELTTGSDVSTTSYVISEESFLNAQISSLDSITISDDDSSSDAAGLLHSKRRQHEYSIGKKIGQGGMGAVYSAEHIKSGKTFAVKKVNCITTGAMTLAVQEIWPVRQLKHPNIVEYLDVYFEENEYSEYNDKYVVCIVMELFKDGDLASDIAQRYAVKEYYTCDRLLNMMYQIAAALEYVHSKKIIHRDLKPMNIFRKGELLKLGDFGLAKNVEESMAASTAGTQRYMAPEIFMQETLYSYKADIWSLGVCFYELLALEVDMVPYLEVFRSSTFYLTIEKKLAQLGYPARIVSLLLACLKVEPEDRPSSAEVVLRLQELIDMKDRLDIEDESDTVYAQTFNTLVNLKGEHGEAARWQAAIKLKDTMLNGMNSGKDNYYFDKLVKEIRYFDACNFLLQNIGSHSLAYFLLALAYQISPDNVGVSRSIRLKLLDGGARSILGLANSHTEKDISQLAAGMLMLFRLQAPGDAEVLRKVELIESTQSKPN